MSTDEEPNDGVPVARDGYELTEKWDNATETLWRVDLENGTRVSVRFLNTDQRDYDVVLSEGNYHGSTTVRCALEERDGDTVLVPLESIEDARSGPSTVGTRSDSGHSVTPDILVAVRYLMRDTDLADWMVLKPMGPTLQGDWFLP